MGLVRRHRIFTPLAEKTVFASLNDVDRDVREWAVGWLGKMRRRDGRALNALIAALADKDALVRQAAVNGLSNIGPEARAALPVLKETVRDEDFMVSYTARRAVDLIDTGKSATVAGK